MRPILSATQPAARAWAAEALAAGELAVIPTDTIYGIAARPDRPQALQSLFAAKRRPSCLALPVLAASMAQAAQIGQLDGLALALGDAFWPGPLTIVVSRQPSLRGDLGGDPATVGIRLPGQRDLLALLALTGPLATTSANLSGQPTPPSAPAVRQVFGDAVAVYLDGGPAPGGAASTVVSVLGGSITVLRPGPISRDQLLAAAGVEPGGAPG